MTEEQRQREWERLSSNRVSAGFVLFASTGFIVANMTGATGESYSHTLTAVMLIGVIGSGIYIFDATQRMKNLAHRR